MHTQPRPSRATILILAAEIGCDPRVAEKIAIHGPEAARNRVHRERAPGALAKVGITPDGPRAA